MTWLISCHIPRYVTDMLLTFSVHWLTPNFASMTFIRLLISNEQGRDVRYVTVLGKHISRKPRLHILMIDSWCHCLEVLWLVEVRLFTVSLRQENRAMAIAETKLFAVRKLVENFWVQKCLFENAKFVAENLYFGRNSVAKLKTWASIIYLLSFKFAFLSVEIWCEISSVTIYQKIATFCPACFFNYDAAGYSPAMHSCYIIIFIIFTKVNIVNIGGD